MFAHVYWTAKPILKNLFLSVRELTWFNSIDILAVHTIAHRVFTTWRSILYGWCLLVIYQIQQIMY